MPAGLFCTFEPTNLPMIKITTITKEQHFCDIPGCDHLTDIRYDDSTETDDSAGHHVLVAG